MDTTPVPTPEETAALVAQIEDVHGDTESEERAAVLLAAMVALRRFSRAADARGALTAPDALDRAARALAMDDGDGPAHYDSDGGANRRRDLIARSLLIVEAAMGTRSLDDIAAFHGYRLASRTSGGAFS